MSERETDRDDSKREKQSPTHRVSFARINGADRDGDILGPAREIGAIWERKDREGEGILRFDHIPEEMRSRNGGVIFIKELREKEPKGEKSAPRGKDDGHDR